jgi:nitrate reductase assembly molybdenum cofactor insertion protein NarJ
MDEKIEDLDQSLITYHIRFQRLCKELTEYTTLMTEFLAGSAHLPPEFHADFKPLFLKYADLYTEFGECMENIGNNGRAYFRWFKEYTDAQQKKIDTLEQMLKISELVNEIQEKVIESEEKVIEAMKT